MSTPRAPRKSTGGVDVQLEEFETDLRAALELQLMVNTHMGFWNETDHLSDEDNESIRRVIAECFIDMAHRYSAVPVISELLAYCLILIQNVVWAAMNVPWPVVPELHIEAVINNAMEVYNRQIYAHLRTEMIMANHNCEVLQRTWRRCITDPSHPACRRRLEYEFEEQLRDLNAL
jgi:hypothetical protein